MPTNLYNKIVGGRFKEFLLSKYDSINAAAEYLETSGDSLRNSYFNGKALPGAKIIHKLIILGCDINWLLNEDLNDNKLPHKQKEKEGPLEKRLKDLEEENKKLKKKIAAYESAIKYLDKAKGV
jgi:predicted ribosome quality control (RQC) complex YloA/Tae2 family protein